MNLTDFQGPCGGEPWKSCGRNVLTWEYQCLTKIIYHLLCCAFGQCIAISQVVDLNVLDEVAILLVYLVFDPRGTGSVGVGRGSGGLAGVLVMIIFTDPI